MIFYEISIITNNDNHLFAYTVKLIVFNLSSKNMGNNAFGYGSPETFKGELSELLFREFSFCANISLISSNVTHLSPFHLQFVTSETALPFYSVYRFQCEFKIIAALFYGGIRIPVRLTLFLCGYIIESLLSERAIHNE